MLTKISFFVLAAGMTWLLIQAAERRGRGQAGHDYEFSSPASTHGDTLDYLTPIDNRGNYFSGSLTADQIRAAYHAGVRMIYRFNGDTIGDRGHLSVSVERALCDELGIGFEYYNIEGRLLNVARVVSASLRGGDVLLHCRNGAHRAPAIAAAYLTGEGVDPDEVVETVGWTKLVRRPGAYAKYVKPALGR